MGKKWEDQSRQTLLDVFGGHTEPRRGELRARPGRVVLALLQRQRKRRTQLAHPQESGRKDAVLHCRWKTKISENGFPFDLFLESLVKRK